MIQWFLFHHLCAAATGPIQVVHDHIHIAVVVEIPRHNRDPGSRTGSLRQLHRKIFEAPI